MRRTSSWQLFVATCLGTMVALTAFRLWDGRGMPTIGEAAVLTLAVGVASGLFHLLRAWW